MIEVNKLVPTEITFGKDQLRYQWLPFDDRVMGGKSSSIIEQHDDYITYRGIIRNINNSAWSCIRSNRIDQDLSPYTSIEIKLKTDGRPYVFEIEYNEGWQHEKIGFMIHTVPNNWTTVHFPIADFRRVKFGEMLPGEVDLSVLKHILRYNFFVAEAIVGEFKLEVESIKFF
ncbi:CIA30 family protein [uncultured Nonlabens sp.]|uniref:CIA30 family protein n=1 Tax=uncultured Nonlabens sp. TaxID=859306 RepID=UPI00262A08C8|nr:CIA30 family protein [uncultured Nonlabens sp.]